MSETTNPFDFVSSISFTKNNMMSSENYSEDIEKDYIPFIVNKALSYHSDTVLFANQMNQWSKVLTNRMQYEFYLYAPIRRKKRFAKWVKPEQNETVELIMSAYKYNRVQAEQVLKIFTPAQIEILKNKMKIGGDKNNGRQQQS